MCPIKFDTRKHTFGIAMVDTKKNYRGFFQIVTVTQILGP
jgi:hypothetical protein